MYIRVQTYLTPAEHGHLREMMASDTTGCETESEFVRLLLCREWNRRKGLPKPTAAEWQTTFRQIRPINPNSKRQLKRKNVQTKRVSTQTSSGGIVHPMLSAIGHGKLLPATFD
jgi:hypothetical protein